MRPTPDTRSHRCMQARPVVSADARRGDHHTGPRRGRATRRRRVPPRTGRDGRRGRHRHGRRPQSRRPGGYRNRQVARLPRAGCALWRKDRRGHRHQGAAGPVGRQGPPLGCRRHRQRPHLRRTQGSQQLRVPPAGIRDRRPRKPTNARPRVGRSSGCRRHVDRRFRGRHHGSLHHRRPGPELGQVG